MIAAISFLIGFAFGYGVRELISRRRRAAERKRFYERHRELREQKKDITDFLL
jgi:hypothetical protein